MAVTVERPPKAPRLTGDARRDMSVLYQYTRELSRFCQQMYERTGASSDLIAATTVTANTAAATADASQAGATVPTEGGSVTLTPANPLSYTIEDEDSVTINVAAHTRSDAASPLLAGSIGGVSRGIEARTYYVYYSDAGDLGGAQTYLSSLSLSTVTGTAGYRIIGTVVVPKLQYSDRYL